MAIVSTGLSAAGLRSTFFSRYLAISARFEQLATRVDSNKDAETYKWLGALPMMRPWGTGRLAKGLRTESYTVENEEYESTIAVRQTALEDDQTGQIRIQVNAMARAARRYPDYLLGQLLILGATAGYNSYDGVTFFNAAHVSGASGSQDNDLAATAAAATKTVDECKAALQASIAAMMAFNDDQGQPTMMDPEGLVILVPPAMYFPMLHTVQAAMITNTSNVIAGIAAVISFPYLSLGTTFYTCKVDEEVRPFIFQDRLPIEFDALERGSEVNFRQGENLYGVRARYALTYGMWQYCVRTIFNN